MTEKNENDFRCTCQLFEAIQAGKEIDKILVKRDIQSELSKELFAELKGRMIPVQRVPVGTHQPHHPQKPSGSHSFYFSHYLSKKTEDIVPYLLNKEKIRCSSCWTALPMYATLVPLPALANVPE